MSAKVIALSQHKGGVGKTTSCINIAAALGKRKYKVLAVDLDAQANLTESMGLPASGIRSIADVMNDSAELPILKTTHFDVVPASLDLAGVEAQLYAKMLGRETVLKSILAEVRSQYDFILIDCPPSLGLLTINALAASDDIIIPAQAEFLAMRGLNSLLDIVKLVKTQLNKKLAVFGVLVTQYDKRKLLNRDTGDAIAEIFPKELFQTKIRENVSLAEAPTAKQDIFSYAPDSNGAADYESLADEVLNRYKMPSKKKIGTLAEMRKNVTTNGKK